MRSRLPILGVEPDGTVRARIHLRGGPGAEAAVRALGVRIARVSEDGRVLYAALSAADIDRVAAQDVVAKISPIVGAKVNAGSVLSEGVAALRADRVQALLRVTGKKVRIGVISDGIEHIAAPAATGDIPATGGGAPKVELCPLNDNSGDEGTAMLEIVHDMAPSAALAFCPAFGDTGQQGLADAVTWLATQAFGGKGADVIVDDVGYLTEPFFQDGVIAQAVDAAAAHGVAVLLVGRQLRRRALRAPLPGHHPRRRLLLPVRHARLRQRRRPGAGHRLGRPGRRQRQLLRRVHAVERSVRRLGERLRHLHLRHNGNIAGDPAGDFPIGAPGVDAQDGNDDPMEVAFVVNLAPGPTPVGTVKGFFMVIDRFFANPNKLLELQFNGFFAVDPAKNIADGSIFGHAASRGAMAVAATGAVENIDGTANPGLDVIEEFSSRGPSRIFFTPAGAPAPEVRRKPNTTAVDGTSVTGVNFFTPFFGTSASAPHAAAVAVLLKDVDPGLGPAGIARILRETSLERGDPGFDTTWGFGLIDAFAAAKRAGQVGNSPLFWVCLPTKKGIQLVVPEFLIPGALALGLDFGRCD